MRNKRLKLSHKLYAMLGLTVSGFLAILVVALLLGARNGKLTRFMEEGYFPASQRSQTLKLALVEIDRAFHEAARSSDPSHRAEAQMHRLAEEARRRWPICRLVMLHRIGRVDVGQPSVLIAVSTPHRAQGFEACRFLIDRLKAEATIWKKEVWGDGSSTWVGMT